GNMAPHEVIPRALDFAAFAAPGTTFTPWRARPRPGPSPVEAPVENPKLTSGSAPVSDGFPPLHPETRIIGQGPLGPILDGYQGRWADAVDWLRSAQTGDARGVLEHPEVPDPIDVVWGNELGGLRHILKDHPEVVDDLPERLQQMRAVSASENR